MSRHIHFRPDGDDADMDDAPETVEELDNAIMAKHLTTLISRCLIGYSAEADSLTIASRDSKFVKAFEGSSNDGALVVHGNDFANLPDDPTDRFYHSYQNLHNERRNTIVPLEAKTFVWRTGLTTNKQKLVHKTCQGSIVLKPAQVSTCQAIILANLNEPEFIAFIPRSYFRLWDEQADNEHLATLYFGTCDRSLACCSPFPSSLSHLVMRKSDLPQMLEDFAEKAVDPDKVLINPYTGHHFERQIMPELHRFSTITGGNTPEFRLRHRLHRIFNSLDRADMVFKNPTHAPLTSDICLEHTLTKEQIFIDHKYQLVDVENILGGKSRLSHLQQYESGNMVFTYAAIWDWILTMKDDTKGYLICKDDIPEGMWHAAPDEDGYIHAEVDTTFLTERHVDLAQPEVQVYADLCRILKPAGASAADPPRKATLTYEDILTNAAPGSALVIDIPGVENVDMEEDAELQVNEAEQPALAGNAADPDLPAGPEEGHAGEGDNDGQDVEDSEEEDDKGNFLTTVGGARKRVVGGAELRRDGFVIQRLLQACRAKGEGCVLDLGFHNPMGNIGFIQYTWTREDKLDFDQTGSPPCWPGKLANSIPMITLVTQHSKWRESFAPVEGTTVNVRAYLDAMPCLVLITAKPTELGHIQSQKWLVPTEFMPKFQVSDFVKEVQHDRCTLYLENQRSVEEFLIADTDLHTILLQFVSSTNNVLYGYGNINIDPAPYLKNIGQYKKNCDVNFDRCVVGYKHYRDTT